MAVDALWRGRLHHSDALVWLCLKEAGLPAAEEHLPEFGLQTVPRRPAAAGERVRLRRGPYPSATRGVGLLERWHT